MKIQWIEAQNIYKYLEIVDEKKITIQSKINRRNIFFWLNMWERFCLLLCKIKKKKKRKNWWLVVAVCISFRALPIFENARDWKCAITHGTLHVKYIQIRIHITTNVVAILITTILFVYFVLIHFIFNKKKRETIALGKQKHTHVRTHTHICREK